MFAAMPAEIDPIASNAGKANRRRDDGGTGTHCGDDAAMMNRIARAIDDARAGGDDRCDGGIDDGWVAALRDIRHDFEKRIASLAQRSRSALGLR